MVKKKVSTPVVKSLPKLTRYNVVLGDPVWVKVGQGECAGIVVGIKKLYARVKFLTGAKMNCAWDGMRFREEQA